jgi:hypothetical protein
LKLYEAQLTDFIAVISEEKDKLDKISEWLISLEPHIPEDELIETKNLLQESYRNINESTNYWNKVR